MATILERRTKKGVHYRVQIRLRGHPAQVATFERKTDAKRWAQEVETEMRQGRFFASIEARQRTVAELIDRYIAEVLGSRSGGDVRDRTAQLDWWRAKVGERYLVDLTPRLIAELRESLGRGDTPTGRPVKAATQARYIAALSHALSIAVKEWQWLDDNPCRKVRRPSEPRGRMRYLSEDERRRLLAACLGSSDSRLYPLVVLAVSTGGRRGELMGLRWRDLDLVGGAAILDQTKNGDRRRLPLTGLVLEMLSERSKVRRLDDDFVFADQEGRAEFPRYAWKAAVAEAGLSDFRFHDLRHSAASYLAMNGATLAEIAEVLGHRTLQMVKRYAHLSPQHTTAVVARMNEAIFG
ncbi:MAG TPA: site-specific integrase [Thermoanaerobaculia bacterium]|nr:site-specific integrase [Thermoanaerobaculia bacterium]